MIRDLCVRPAESSPLHLPVLIINFSFHLSIPWPRRKPPVINYLHIICTWLWLLLSIYSGWLSMERFAICVCVCVCVWLRMHVLRAGKRVHFDAQFKVGWHYLFMPLLFLFPLRVKNSWRSILGRSRRTQTESIASQLNENTLMHTHTFRTCGLSIHLPSWVVICRTLLSQPPPHSHILTHTHTHTHTL